MPDETRDVPATALPDVQGMIEQLMRLIPGMMVTVAGGVVTSVLPGKIKLAGLPVVGYGMFMLLDALRPTDRSVIFQPEPTYPTQAGAGEEIQIVAWAHNVSSDILMVRMRLIDRDTGEEIGPVGHVDFELNPDAGKEYTWDATMIGPNDAHIKLELGVIENGNYRVTDFRDIDIKFVSSGVDIDSWTPVNVNVGDGVTFSNTITNNLGRGINYNFQLRITKPDGSWFRTFDGFGYLGTQPANKSITIDSILNSGWSGEEGEYVGQVRVWEDETSVLVGERIAPIMIASEELPQRKIFGYVKNDIGTGIGFVKIELNGIIAYSGTGGYYEITNIPEQSGYMDITASFSGYTSVTKTIMLPGPEEQLQVDFVLLMEDISAQINNFEVNGI